VRLPWAGAAREAEGGQQSRFEALLGRTSLSIVEVRASFEDAQSPMLSALVLGQQSQWHGGVAGFVVISWIQLESNLIINN
jgi:hypothetical protein